MISRSPNWPLTSFNTTVTGQLRTQMVADVYPWSMEQCLSHTVFHDFLQISFGKDRELQYWIPAGKYVSPIQQLQNKVFCKACRTSSEAGTGSLKKWKDWWNWRCNSLVSQKWLTHVSILIHIGFSCPFNQWLSLWVGGWFRLVHGFVIFKLQRKSFTNLWLLILWSLMVIKP